MFGYPKFIYIFAEQNKSFACKDICFAFNKQ